MAARRKRLTPSCHGSVLPLRCVCSQDILNNDEGQRPLVVSASYAYDCDTDSCLGDGVTEYYDSVFQSLAALGVSVVISSGDDGTNGAGRAAARQTRANRRSMVAPVQHVDRAVTV